MGVARLRRLRSGPVPRLLVSPITGIGTCGCRKSQATGGAARGAGSDGIVRRQGIRGIDAEHLAVLVDVKPGAALRSIIM